MNLALWIVQGLLALIFLFAGGMKLEARPSDRADDQAIGCAAAGTGHHHDRHDGGNGGRR
jgi:hypothetical protein